MRLQKAVSAVVAWRLSNSLLEMWCAFEIVEFQVSAAINKRSLNARSCAYWMTELAKIDSRLSVYFAAVAFLHVAYKSLRHGLNDELMDIVVIVVGH